MPENENNHTEPNIKERSKAKLERIADVATKWIGSTSSIILHTLLFIIAFLLPPLHIIAFNKMLLVLTTVVSLEAIYLAIFIQMSVNKNTQDIEDIQEDVEEIQEDIEEIQEDVDEIQEDVEEIQEDVEEIQEDVEEIQEDVEELQDEEDGENNPDLKTSVPAKEVPPQHSREKKIAHIQTLLSQLQNEINELKH